MGCIACAMTGKDKIAQNIGSREQPNEVSVTVYDGQPFPGLADAVRARDAARAKREVARVAAAVERFADGLQQASSLAAPR